MVGEIRDTETAQLATHAALTGHIVLSTLHTNNALGVIPRLIDLGVKPFLIPSTVNIAVAQRLVRRLCPVCCKKTKPKEKIRSLIFQEVISFPPALRRKYEGNIWIYQPVGCGECGGTGYSGRVGIFEVLKMTEELADIILRAPTESNIAKEAKRQEMVTMRQDGIIKVLEGITSIEEVVRVTEQQNQ
jgi:type II secretory ATPase GspE/PulE/Tfp pilus assembly ATPase PilB-like protein